MNKKKIDILHHALEKALNNGFEWDELDKETWDELSEIERAILLRGLIEQDLYYCLIFNHDFAKALWGKEDGMLATYSFAVMTPDGEYTPTTSYPKSYIFLDGWEYNLQQMLTAKDSFKYLEENT